VTLDDDNSVDERDLLTRDMPFDNTEGTKLFVVWDSLPDGRVSVKQDSDGSFHVMEQAAVILCIRVRLGM
jgi:hypothetical protein